MRYFSSIIDKLTLIDPPLVGGVFTCSITSEGHFIQDALLEAVKCLLAGPVLNHFQLLLDSDGIRREKLLSVSIYVTSWGYGFRDKERDCGGAPRFKAIQVRSLLRN